VQPIRNNLTLTLFHELLGPPAPPPVTLKPSFPHPTTPMFEEISSRPLAGPYIGCLKKKKHVKKHVKKQIKKQVKREYWRR
jgi:hypothetical protein